MYVKCTAVRFALHVPCGDRYEQHCFLGSLKHRRNNSDQSVSEKADRNEACCDCKNKERYDHCLGHVSALQLGYGQPWEIISSMLRSCGCA
jgi:hypothetical protein